MDTDETPQRRADDGKKDRWHLGREIPLAILIALVIQTLGGVWWLAGVSAKIDYAIATMEEFKRERYTREDARRDRELLESKVDQNRLRDVEHERRLDMLERGMGIRAR